MKLAADHTVQFHIGIKMDMLLETAKGECPGGVMVKAMDCGIVVSEFVLQSRYYVHLRANTIA